VPVLATSCTYSPHYRATATSGAGTNHGTGAYTTTWTNWSVPEGNGSYAFTDEGVWLGTQGNYQISSVEAGFYSGYGMTVAWTNGMLPYYTLNDGQNEYDGAGDYLTANKYIWMAAGDLGWVQIDIYPFNIGSYTVQAPRQNYAQGETDCNDDWMGGGSGESFTMYFNPASGGWAQWGFMTNTYNSPYWYSQISNFQWSNGGY